MFNLTIKYLSLFSGVGGFELGLEESKHKVECIGFSEIDKHATNIYKYRFPEHPELGDVTKIITNNLPDFELLVGGFPCQPFSIAGKRCGFDDPRGNLFFEIARILRDKKPKYFLLENVRGILSHDKGQTFTTILNTLDQLGYSVQWQNYNSKNFGVPQNRERVFLRGCLRGECKQPVFIESCNIHENPLKVKTLKKGRQGEQVYRRDGLVPTITRGGGNSANRVLIKRLDEVDNNYVRRITPVEAERLQGFPDDWTKYGVDKELIPEGARYACVGNAVTVPLVKSIFDGWDM